MFAFLESKYLVNISCFILLKLPYLYESMTPFCLSIIADPVQKKPLKLVNPVYDGENIITGTLIAENGNEFPIINGIPRFLDENIKKSVDSFGDEWNYFNFTDYKTNWLNHTVKNTFGSTDYFKNKIIVDAGGGSGSQSKWFLEYGAKHVILLELSHSVDDVVKNNLKEFNNVDIIQCSIDNIPLLNSSIKGLVYCHNVIQHTPSVEKTAKALFNILSSNGEFVFNCYPLNDQGILRYIRFHFIHKNIRRILSRMPFKVILVYSTFMAFLRLVPIIGLVLEKTMIAIQGDIPIIPNESFFNRLKRRFKATRINTFDAYGSHSFQHQKSDFEILSLVISLQNDTSKIKNLNKYFSRPTPIGCALRVFK